jgi:hypothetical protein
MSQGDCSEFRVSSDRYRELAGYPKVRLYMSCEEHDDMDVYVQIRKTNADGKLLVSLNYPCPMPEPEVGSMNVCRIVRWTYSHQSPHANNSCRQCRLA